MPELLTAADLLELQQLNTDNMPDRALVKRPPTSGARASGGTQTLVPATIYTTEPCRVGPAVSPSEVAVGDVVTATSLRMVAFAKGRDVQARDLITVTLSTGQVLALEAVGSQQPHSYEVGLFIVCQLKGAPV